MQDEDIMVKRRHRFKQTTTLAQRLKQEAGRLRDRARELPPGKEQTTVLRKVRQAETALGIDAWLSSPQDAPPGSMMALMSKSPDRQKRPVKSKSLLRSAP